MYFPGDFVLAQLDDTVRFVFVVRYDEASYTVLTSRGAVSSKLEHAVRAGWRRNAQLYTLVNASSQNVCHHEAYAAFVACAVRQSQTKPDFQDQSQTSTHTYSELTCKVLAFLDGLGRSLDLRSVVNVSTTLETMLRLAQQQTSQLIDQHIRDALYGHTSFSLPATMCPDDILLHHANSPSIKAQVYAYYNIDMHALLDEYFSDTFFAQHAIVQLGGFNMRKYTCRLGRLRQSIHTLPSDHHTFETRECSCLGTLQHSSLLGMVADNWLQRQNSCSQALLNTAFNF